MIVLLDTETTGVDEGAACIEVAIAIYSLRHAAPICSFSSLIRAESNPAEHVNRIAPALLVNAPLAGRVWDEVDETIPNAGVRAIVAHGAAFDRRFVPRDVAPNMPWVCSLEDLEWPRPSSSRSLVALALAHDLGVSHAHRAAVDVDLLGRLFTRAAELGANLDAMITRGLRPKALFAVADSRFDPARNALAKEAGFRWDGETKRWARRMCREDVGTLGFAVREVPT